MGSSWILSDASLPKASSLLSNSCRKMENSLIKHLPLSGDMHIDLPLFPEGTLSPYSRDWDSRCNGLPKVTGLWDAKPVFSPQHQSLRREVFCLGENLPEV